jgi:hypothetical protein
MRNHARWSGFGVVIALAISLSAASSVASSAPLSPYSPINLECRLIEVDIAMGTFGGGNIAITFTGKTIFSASLSGVVWTDKRHCKRIAAGPLPNPTVPSPSYPMGRGDFVECSVSRPVIIHAHFLKRSGRLTGVYVSVRLRGTGRFVAAGLLRANRSGRQFLGPTCISR